MAAVEGNGRGAAPHERPTADLVKQLSRQVSTLVHQEVELAKAEMADKGKEAGVGAGLLGGAGVAALLMLGSLTAFLIIVLALAVPAWASALLITLCWGAVGAVLAVRGRERLQAAGKPVPEQTVETLKEDVQWLRDRK